MLEAIILVVFPFCMVFSAVSDTLSMKIANTVPALLIATFLLVAPLTGMPLEQIGWHLLTGLMILGVTFVLFAVGHMGGGDAKLLAATGIWLGFGLPVMDYILYSAILGGLLTIAILVFRASPLHATYGDTMFLKNFSKQAASKVPYGIALGSAGLFAYSESPLAMWAMQRLAG